MKLWRIAALLAGLLAVTTLAAEEPADSSTDGNNDQLSLITATPAEGFDLAVNLARRAVVATQPDKEVLFDQRPEYSEDAEDLIAASHVVAVHFQTIARANDYWRD
ncbi:MAG: hexameric tyrosine-coordinated heme protein [Xanthomonadales bacterium]|nr:hexameric tyrosine-coordinated heme protein [Xanthomonadales bacterium]